jgi:hypothetical protein
VNGTIAGVAWTEYGIPIKIVADERGTDSAATQATMDSEFADVKGASWSASSSQNLYGIFTKATAGVSGNSYISGVVNTIVAKTDQLTFTVANEVDSNSLTGGTSAAAIYSEFTSGSNADAFKATGFNTVAPDNVSITAILADSNELQTNQGNWLTATGFNTVAPDNASITAIKGKTDQLTFTVANEVDSNSLTGGTSPAAIYTEFTSGSNADAFKATGFNTVVPDNASITLILADSNELQTNQGNWLTATGFATVNPDNASITLILADTNELQTNQGNWGGGDATAATQATMVSHLTDIKGSGFASSDALESIRDRGDSAWTTALLATGAGAVSHEVTINVGGSPESGVDVWVSTDLAGSNVVAGTLSTDAFGKATFSLDVGSYYLWVQKAETNFSNPTSFTVS